MPTRGQTAVVVPVPVADRLLQEVASSHSQAVRQGVAAHVSLLYPFLDASVVDDEVLGWLREFAARTRPIAVEFLDVVPAPGFVHLPVPALRPLVAGLRARWPQVVPYGGRFGADPAPHVTLAMGLAADDGAAVAARVRRFLPLTSSADHVWIVAYDEGWSLVETFPLRGADGEPESPGRQ
ncbi:conserved hypothetical protein [Frankia canadensis]|uniref:2'-5' RNA ligase n=1 Tax=Frankia canadensis TaxID=1836972 RepID=A0A2I2L0D8_9ACTN|nr:2'-5' RNA ligase family protein [Frankia canadensis]SNQ51378.1 conserved hypothetical protein [Frankia canadensis]SOU58668.1 conserved hypothetical protein [Frankia canadensis]